MRSLCALVGILLLFMPHKRYHCSITAYNFPFLFSMVLGKRIKTNVNELSKSKPETAWNPVMRKPQSQRAAFNLQRHIIESAVIVFV